ELALAMLKGGEAGVLRFNLLRSGSERRPTIDLSGSDLQNLHLAGVNLENVLLDGADLRGANLGGAILPQMQNGRLDGARLVKSPLRGLKDCSVLDADLTNLELYTRGQAGKSFENCDFTRARLSQARFIQVTAPGVVFCDAQFDDANCYSG